MCSACNSCPDIFAKLIGKCIRNWAFLTLDSFVWILSGAIASSVHAMFPPPGTGRDGCGLGVANLRSKDFANHIKGF